MSSANENPTFHAEDTHNNFVWKITNYPWGVENCNLTVDNVNNEATVRSENRKFFKKFKIPALSRVSEPMREESFQVSHNKVQNVLVINYKKPTSVIKVEDQEKKERMEASMRIENDGKVDCNQS
jgi:hypothetical protein